MAAIFGGLRAWDLSRQQEIWWLPPAANARLVRHFRHGGADRGYDYVLLTRPGPAREAIRWYAERLPRGSIGCAEPAEPDPGTELARGFPGGFLRDVSPPKPGIELACSDSELHTIRAVAWEASGATYVASSTPLTDE
jgi:hypothetical protein